jgi:hypothetical protein
MDSRMRELEYFHQIQLFPGAWTIVRVDGRTFSRFTAQRFEKPYDANFRDLMVFTSKALLEDLQGIYACTHSDEISVLFPPGWNILTANWKRSYPFPLAWPARHLPTHAAHRHILIAACGWGRTSKPWLTIFNGARKMRRVVRCMAGVTGHCVSRVNPPGRRHGR